MRFFRCSKQFPKSNMQECIRINTFNRIISIGQILHLPTTESCFVKEASSMKKHQILALFFSFLILTTIFSGCGPSEQEKIFDELTRPGSTAPASSPVESEAPVSEEDTDISGTLTLKAPGGFGGFELPALL